MYLVPKGKGEGQGKGKAKSDAEDTGKGGGQRSRSPRSRAAGEGEGEGESQATGKAQQKGKGQQFNQDMARAYMRQTLLNDLIYGKKGKETFKGSVVFLRLRGKHDFWPGSSSQDGDI